MKKEIIISAAVDGRDKYSEIVKGLEGSIVDAGWRGDVEIYKSFPDWVIPHKSIPYAFKYQFIRRKLHDGYEKIIWLDSTMRLMPGKNILDLLLDDDGDGVIGFDNIGHPLEFYINDTAIKNIGPFDISTKQLWGGALIFDFETDTAFEVLDEIIDQIMLGSFNDDNTDRPNFRGHRHDQAVLSAILDQMGIDLLPYGVIAAPKDVTDKTVIIYGDK